MGHISLMDNVILLKELLSDLKNPEIVLSSLLKKTFVKHTNKTSGFYDFSIWLEAFEYLIIEKGTTYRKTFKPDYKRINAYDKQTD